MKVFVILESFTDYKGGNATSFGVFKTKESAKAHIVDAIIERLGYSTIKEWEEDYGACFTDCWIEENEHWKLDRDDDVIEFYIQEDNLEN